MTTLKELREKVEKERAKQKLRKEKEDLEKELFNLRHARKIELVKRVKGNLVHMGKNAVAMAKPKKKKSGFTMPDYSNFA